MFLVDGLQFFGLLQRLISCLFRLNDYWLQYLYGLLVMGYLREVEIPVSPSNLQLGFNRLSLDYP